MIAADDPFRYDGEDSELPMPGEPGPGEIPMNADASPGSDETSRRDFALTTAGLAAASWATLSSQAVAQQPEPLEPLIRRGDTVLLQGDSITDAGRDRQHADAPNHHLGLGEGYGWLAASQLLVSRPEDGLKFLNRGISGNKVFELAERWQEDCLDLKPDVLSILIGVNDVWHKLSGDYDGTIETYERDYHGLVRRTKDALPNVRLVVCEPFLLRCGRVDDEWIPPFQKCRAAARRVADAAGARFVPFQAMFDIAVRFAPPEHWAEDGIHPSPFGAALMAHNWLATVGA